MEKVKKYNSEIADIPRERIAYVDETGMDTFIHREYGWSAQGTPVLGTISGRKFKRTGVVAAQMDKHIIAPFAYDGTMDGALFELWFEQVLLRHLPSNSVIVMDNASFHRKARLFLLAETAGHRLVFLPPYSPELNPIENFWSCLKRRLRKILPLFSSFDDALRSAFQGI